ncbi:hypothetical protein BGW42_005532 [Actinomortierella wolfii]|nr:hypothetical protein BGW42_005532 [Actinomortierella wolfii]
MRYGAVWRSEKSAASSDKKHGSAGLNLFKKTIILSVLRFIPGNLLVDMNTVEKALEDFKTIFKEEHNTCSTAAYRMLLPKNESRNREVNVMKTY